MYHLYDEIDTEVLVDNQQLAKVNEDIFWACRKMEAIKHEFELGEGFFYSDTDILLYKPLSFEYDLIVWSPEERVPNASIYLDWQFISTPPNYIMPDWLQKTEDAFNCGIIYFKDKEKFLEYRQHFYNFVIDNPGDVDRAGCSLINDRNVINIPMCNAEQRILKGFAIKEQLDFYTIKPTKGRGLSPNGDHYFWYRAAWSMVGVLHDLSYINMINKCNQILAEAQQFDILQMSINAFKYK